MTKTPYVEEKVSLKGNLQVGQITLPAQFFLQKEELSSHTLDPSNTGLSGCLYLAQNNFNSGKSALEIIQARPKVRRARHSVVSQIIKGGIYAP